MVYYCIAIDLLAVPVGLIELTEPVAPAATEEPAATPGAKAVWEDGKRLLMQPSTQRAKADAAAAEPSP